MRYSTKKERRKLYFVYCCVILLFIFCAGCTKKDDAEQPQPIPRQIESSFNKDDVIRLESKGSQGDIESIRRLLDHYAALRDVDKQIYWARKGAASGDASSQFVLFVHLSSAADNDLRKEGLNALMKAAACDHQAAQFELAALYESGNGINKDINEARKWYDKCAQLGDLHCIQGVIRILISRESDIESQVEAYGWTLILYERLSPESAANVENGAKYKSKILSNINKIDINKEDFIARAEKWAKKNIRKISGQPPN
jgi:TPR repeat protein